MKIGLFGGTFNPVHFGHLRAALEVREGFGLKQVVLIPAAVPPHKERGGVAAAADRGAMLTLAVEGCSALAVSDVETRRPGPSYTIDTVRHFRCSLPADTEILLVVGLDAFLEIDSWKSFRELLGLVPVIVLSRPGSDPGACSGCTSGARGLSEGEDLRRHRRRRRRRLQGARHPAGPPLPGHGARDLQHPHPAAGARRPADRLSCAGQGPALH